MGDITNLQVTFVNYTQPNGVVKTYPSPTDAACVAYFASDGNNTILATVDTGSMCVLTNIISQNN